MGDTGTPHYQGYIELSRPCRMHQLLESFDDIPHLEQRRGSREQARDYCRKPESRLEEAVEVGEWKERGQGRRSDLIEIAKKINEGGSMRDIAAEYPSQFILYNRGIREYRNEIRESRGFDSTIQIDLHYGEPGSGKTHWCWGAYGAEAYWKPHGDKWWDGYETQNTVVIDDYKSWFQLHYLLRVLDRYPLNVETKGSFVQAHWNRVAITTSVDPKAWYEWSRLGGDNQWQALKRRITEWFFHWIDNNNEYRSIQFESYETMMEYVFNMNTQ